MYVIHDMTFSNVFISRLQLIRLFNKSKYCIIYWQKRNNWSSALNTICCFIYRIYSIVWNIGSSGLYKTVASAYIYQNQVLGLFRWRDFQTLFVKAYSISLHYILMKMVTNTFEIIIVSPHAMYGDTTCMVITWYAIKVTLVIQFLSHFMISLKKT